MKNCRKDMEALLREVEARGWTVVKTNNNHWRMTHPGTAKVIFASSTPSDWRAVTNMRSMVQRAEREMQGEPAHA